MTTMSIPNIGGSVEINVGDRIKFRAATRFGAHTVWRKVTGFWERGLYAGEPTVVFNGWSNFIVHSWEILEVENAGTNQ